MVVNQCSKVKRELKSKDFRACCNIFVSSDSTCNFLGKVVNLDLLTITSTIGTFG